MDISREYTKGLKVLCKLSLWDKKKCSDLFSHPGKPLKKKTLPRLGSLDHSFAFLYAILIYSGFIQNFVFKYVAIISALFGGLLESQRTLSEAFKTGLYSRELHTKKIFVSWNLMDSSKIHLNCYRYIEIQMFLGLCSHLLLWDILYKTNWVHRLH